MKACLFFLALFVYINCFSQENNNVVLTKLIVYKVLNESFTTEQKPEAIKLFNILTDTNVIYHYDCYEENPLFNNKYKYDGVAIINKLSNKEICSSIYIEIIKTLQHPSLPNDYYDSLINRDYSKEDFPVFSFSEKWVYNTVNFQFYKKVNAIAPKVRVYSLYKEEFLGYKPLLHILFNNSAFESANWTLKNVQYDVCINYYIKRREDVCFGFWTVGDNIEASDRYGFMEHVFTSIDNGTIKAYKDKNKTIEIKSTDDIILSYDSIYCDPVFPPWEESLVVIANKMVNSDLIGIRFVEDWFFDIEKQSFIKKVKAIGFMIEEFDDKTFKSIGYKPLFWVFFD